MRFVVLVWAVLGLGCSAIYPFEFERDGGVSDAGVDDAGDGADAAIDGGVCGNTSADPLNCGGCGVECSADEACVASSCRGLRAIDGGDAFTCALTEAGRVFCWGANDLHQSQAFTGRGRAAAREVTIPSSERPTELSVGTWTACVRAGAEAWCWGANFDGMLGVDTDELEAGPRQPLGVFGATHVACGGFHCCAAFDDGTERGMWCWGANTHGQLGNGSVAIESEPELRPVRVRSLPDGEVTGLALGRQFTCAVVDGRLFCWGRNEDGQLGQGDFDDLTEPTEVTALPGTPLRIAAGRTHVCAITGAPGADAGALYCWGTNGDYELGIGSRGDEPTPQRVESFGGVMGVDDVRELALGVDHTCVVREEGAWCWGDSARGQTASEDTELTRPSMLPVPVRTIGAGAWHTCGVSEGRIVCWGYDSAGQLGRNVQLYAPEPTRVEGVDDATRLLVAEAHVCVARGTDEHLECFGSNEAGQLGTGEQEPSSRPVPPVTPLPGVLAIDSYHQHTCVIATGSSGPGLYCFGRNSSGQLARSPTFTLPNPERVDLGTAELLGVATGDTHTCALLGEMGDYGFRCWGSGAAGRHGDGASVGARDTPTDFTPLPGLGSEVSLFAGDGFTCGIRGGEVHCWGMGTLGRLGNGRLSNSSSPVSTMIADADFGDAGHDSSCVRAGTRLRCWGANDHGAIGAAEHPVRDPTDEELGMQVEDVSVGFEHACYVPEGGASVFCRGRNAAGQLGTGRYDDAAAFTEVAFDAGVGPFVSVGTGLVHSCALTASGQLYCWGHDRTGRLGLGRALVHSTIEGIVYDPGFSP